MTRGPNEALWRQLNEELLTQMHAWRLQQPTAALRAIETELDARLAHARARMLEDLAMGSTAAAWQEAARLQTPTCPQCGTLLDERGTHPRTLRTHADQELTLTRSYAVCPACGAG